MKEQALKHKPFLILLIVIAGVLVFLGRSVLFQTMRTYPTTPVPANPTDLSDLASSNTMSIKTQDDRSFYTPGDTITYIVSVNAGEQKVVGYDLNLTYDPSILSYVKTENVVKIYDIFPSASRGKLAVTGTIQLQTTNAPLFDHAIVAKLTFKALKQGDAKMHISFKKGETNDSNVIVDTKDVLDGVSVMPTYIGKVVSLSMGKNLSLDKTHSITLDSVTLPDKNCFDCMTSAVFTVTSAGKKESISFQSGGIAGVVTKPQTVDTYSFEIGPIESTAVELFYLQK